MDDLRARIEAEDPTAVEEAIDRLDRGELRVAEKIDGVWIVNAWVKQAILLYFRFAKMVPMEAGALHFHDKVPVKSDLSNCFRDGDPPNGTQGGTPFPPDEFREKAAAGGWPMTAVLMDLEWRQERRWHPCCPRLRTQCPRTAGR